MGITNKFRQCVSFARFAQREGIEPMDLAELLTLAGRAFRAGERECNTGQTAEPARRAFCVKAEAMGYGVRWPGLCPLLTKDGREIHLPTI